MRSPFTITYNPDWRRRPTTAVQAESKLEPSTEKLAPSAAKDLEPVSTEPDPIVTQLKDSTPDLPAPEKPKVRFQMPMPTTTNKLVKRGRPIPPTSEPPAPPATNPIYPLTPETTPERKKSMFSMFSSKGEPMHVHHNPETIEAEVVLEEDSEPEWKHHDSYFPEYTPIYPTTTFADPYAKAYFLTPAEIQAQQHAANVGRAIAVHYPMLPPFADYSSAKGQGAWQSGQWGNPNWTGFGLNGEKLPDTEGKTFGAPMPKGVPNPEPGKGKGKGGDGEGGKGADGGKAEEGGDGGGGGGEGGAGGGGGGGGGGGKKGKGKK